MLVISNQPRAPRSSHFEITRAIYSVNCTQLGPITITSNNNNNNNNNSNNYNNNNNNLLVVQPYLHVQINSADTQADT